MSGGGGGGLGKAPPPPPPPRSLTVRVESSCSAERERERESPRRTPSPTTLRRELRGRARASPPRGDRLDGSLQHAFVFVVPLPTNDARQQLVAACVSSSSSSSSSFLLVLVPPRPRPRLDPLLDPFSLDPFSLDPSLSLVARARAGPQHAGRVQRPAPAGQGAAERAVAQRRALLGERRPGNDGLGDPDLGHLGRGRAGPALHDRAAHAGAV